MSILDLCGRRLSTVSVMASVADAVQLMINNEVGAVAVVDSEGIVAGMFTERDVLEKFALSGRDPRQTAVRESHGRNGDGRNHRCGSLEGDARAPLPAYAGSGRAR